MTVADATYEFRRDNRTDEEMADRISASTMQEAVDARQLCEFFVDHGYQCELIDNGIDNSGKLIKTGNNRKFGAPDFKFRLGFQKEEPVEELVEVKSSPAKICATIKDHCMVRLVDPKNKTWTLMVFNNKRAKKTFVILSPEMLKAAWADAVFLQAFEKFGGKDSWRFFFDKVASLLAKNNYALTTYKQAMFCLPLGTIFTKYVKET
jgi:hypothetical protein